MLERMFQSHPKGLNPRPRRFAISSKYLPCGTALIEIENVRPSVTKGRTGIIIRVTHGGCREELALSICANALLQLAADCVGSLLVL